MTTTIRRLDESRGARGFLDEAVMRPHYAGASKRLASETSLVPPFDGFLSQIDVRTTGPGHDAGVPQGSTGFRRVRFYKVRFREVRVRNPVEPGTWRTLRTEPCGTEPRGTEPGGTL